MLMARMIVPGAAAPGELPGELHCIPETRSGHGNQKERASYVEDFAVATANQLLNSRGVATGGYIGIYTPPNQSTLKKFLRGCFVSWTHLYPPKSNFWLRLC